MSRSSMMANGTLAAIVLASLTGCVGGDRDKLPPESAPAPRVDRGNASLLAGTIGSQCLVGDAQPQALRGFGLVVGLNGTGSADCPTVIREYLAKHMTKDLGPQGDRDRKSRVSPERLIDSPDTAIVEVVGMLPGGARRGTRFDVQVSAIAGTATESLAGGLLLPTELRVFDRSASGAGLVTGAVQAVGSGLVFVDPFSEDERGDPSGDPRVGRVLGGASSVEERNARLKLLQPNYRLAQQIERRVNERCGQRPRVAEAMSRGYVLLHTPPAYPGQPDRFLELVAQLYVDTRPASVERRLQELSRLAVTGGATRELISLAWEGVGRIALPSVRPFYADGDPELRFYAARAGMRMNDLSALPVVGAVAQSDENEWRLQAIGELGECKSPRAPSYLVPLLSDSSTSVRIAAYEALLRRGHPSIRSMKFQSVLDRSRLSFVLDVVECDGPPLIYVRTTRQGRIAVFGPRQAVIPPVFHESDDGSLTVHTVKGSDDLRLFAKRHRRMSDEIVVPPRVVDLVSALGEFPSRDETERLSGLGLSYSEVVRVLVVLSRDGIIAGQLVAEEVGLLELPGPDDLPERPDSDSPLEEAEEREENGPASLDWTQPQSEDDPDWRPEGKESGTTQ